MSLLSASALKDRLVVLRRDLALQKIEKLLVVAMLLAMVGVMAMHLAYLDKFPIAYIDEGWNANATWTWLKTGIQFDSMHAGTLDRVDKVWLRWPLLGDLPWRISFSLFGLGLFQLRLVAWVFGCLLLVATFLVGYRVYGLLSGALAALILSMSPQFLQASHYGRWDVMLAAAGMFAVFLALTAFQKEKWWLHLLAGLLVGVSLDIHQNAVLYGLGLGGLYLAQYGKMILKRKGPWLFVLGGLLGVGYYLAMFILPDPKAYFDLFSLSFGNTHRAPIASLNPLDLLKSLRAEIGRYHFFENSLNFAVIGACFVYLALRRSRGDRLLFAFVLAVFSAFVLIIGNKHDTYAILLYPFLIVLTADALLSLAREKPALPRQRLFAGSLLALYLLFSAVFFSRMLINNSLYDYNGITAELRSQIPAGAKVMGYPTWWIGFPDYTYSSTLNLTYYHVLDGLSLEQAFERIKPDYLIVDTNVTGLLVDQGAYALGSGFKIYDLPKEEFWDFLSKRGQKVLEFDNPFHGLFQLYTIHWDTP